MYKLEKEMPKFLKHNQILIKKDLYYDNKNGRKSIYYSPAYLTTTENINAYYDKMNFEYKKVLTVIGASDHVFNAILRGAIEVDAFDISIYAIMFYYLKEAALKALEYEEFITFLYDYKKFFSKETYDKILPYLNEKAIPFWNMVFSFKNSTQIITSPCFSCHSFIVPDCDRTVNSLKQVSSFLNKNCFYLLKEKIKNCKIRVFLEDVRSLDDIGTKYDYIILSNTIDYVDKEEFHKAVNRYVKKLNIYGQIKVAYVNNSPERYGDKYIVERIESFGSAIGKCCNCGSEFSYNYVLTKKRI